MERRAHRRWLVSWPAELTSPLETATASVVDISYRGCRVRCLSVPPTGRRVLLRMEPRGASITVDQAIARWTAGPHFGVEFALMTMADTEQLSHLLDGFKQ